MIQKNILSRKRKKERIKINSIDDFKDELKKERYKINEFDEEKFKDEIEKIFEVDKSTMEKMYTYIDDTEFTYRANCIEDIIDYIKKIILFENEHNKLCKKISGVKILNIGRLEYEREPSIQDNIENMIKDIERIANEMSVMMNEEDKIKLKELERELDKDYLYSKDIELLKKILLAGKNGLKEKYNTKTKIKIISIEIPKKINHEYIKTKKGSVEYHEYLNNNIPRIQRLIKNMNKYMKIDEKEKLTFKIDQSKTLQDSINMALVIYDGKEFRAISGSNEITGYCISPPLEKAVFKSSKVNKLGKLGIGYDRVNDSEKKIFEEIHKQIEEKELKNEGNLILYSKWEPCPSCYYVINQFCEKHPNIKVQIKYIKKYGEQ